MPVITTLVVDDEETLRKITVLVLENAGHRVFAAENGSAALTIQAKESIDLVISDIVMPETDGIELAQEIRFRYPAV